MGLMAGIIGMALEINHLLFFSRKQSDKCNFFYGDWEQLILITKVSWSFFIFQQSVGHLAQQQLSFGNILKSTEYNFNVSMLKSTNHLIQTMSFSLKCLSIRYTDVKFDSKRFEIP